MKLQELPMLPVFSVLQSNSFVGIHLCVDIQTLQRFEPMHGLLLGVSRLLKKCLINMLDETDVNTLAVKTTN